MTCSVGEMLFDRSSRFKVQHLRVIWTDITVENLNSFLVHRSKYIGVIIKTIPTLPLQCVSQQHCKLFAKGNSEYTKKTSDCMDVRPCHAREMHVHDAESMFVWHVLPADSTALLHACITMKPERPCIMYCTYKIKCDICLDLNVFHGPGH